MPHLALNMWHLVLGWSGTDTQRERERERERERGKMVKTISAGRTLFAVDDNCWEGRHGPTKQSPHCRRRTWGSCVS